MRIQTALCIHESPRDCSQLLRHTLHFFAGSPKDLAILRETCREFKRCVDVIIKGELKRLLGPEMYPLPGQSYGEVYDVAINYLDEDSRKSLRDDCDLRSLRRRGFDFGLIGNYTRKKRQLDKINKAINIICVVPIRFEGKIDEKEKEPRVMVAKVPLGIAFNQQPDYLNDGTKSITAIYMEGKFLHMNKDGEGNVYVATDVDNYHRERDLHDTMRRVQRELLTFDATYPNARCAFSMFLHAAEYGGSPRIYQEYKVECLKLFRDYKLGEKLPNLGPFELCVLNELRMNKIKKHYTEVMEVDYVSAKKKILFLEEQVNRKFRLQEIKRTVHLAFVVGIGMLVVFEKYNLLRMMDRPVIILARAIERLANMSSEIPKEYQ